MRQVVKALAIAVLVPLLSGAEAPPQDETAQAKTTSDNCVPQPKCRAQYTEMEPARHFGQVRFIQHRMMHHKMHRRSQRRM